jgi:hypothetical protein
MTNNMKQASLLSEKFEQVHQRALVIAEEHKIDVHDIDLPVSSQPGHITETKDVSVALP